MFLIHSPQEMQSTSLRLREQGKRIAFVPTMGALHEGHVSLLRMGQKLGDVLVLSIFVNPTQFGPKEDFNKYPRDLDGDLKKIEPIGVDYVFAPEAAQMYGKDYQTYVEVKELTKGLCGRSRPSHFSGVATVVLKLFNIVCPHVAIFGEKDYQQLVTIKRMVADLNLPVEIVGHPIVREPDGLAMSSRNAYLSLEERKAAGALYRSLGLAQKLINSGERDTEKIISATKGEILKTGLAKIDYVEILDPATLNPKPSALPPSLIAIACYIGKTRLIDNCVIK